MMVELVEVVVLVRGSNRHAHAAYISGTGGADGDSA